MSKQRKPWNLILCASLAIVILACSSVQINMFDTPSPAPVPPTLALPTLPVPTMPPPETPLPTVPLQPLPGLEGCWQDGLKVFTIAWQNDQYVVTAFNVVGVANPQIVSQSWDGTSLTWTYRSISLNKSSTITTQSVSGDRLTAAWSDETGNSQSVILRRVPTPFPAHESLPYYDDFSDPLSGWDIYEDEYGFTKYEDGYYSVRSLIKEEGMSSYAYRFFADPVITVDATSVRGPNSNNYSFFIGCNTQINEDGYWFEVELDGYYYVGKWANGKYESLFSGDDYRASNAIRTGKATNHVVVTCARGQLKLEINGEVLFRGSDSTFTEGDINLGAISYEELGAEIHFDNLSVTAP